MRIIDSTSLGNTASTQTGHAAETEKTQSSSQSSSTSKANSAASDSVQLSSLSGRISQSLGADSANRAQRVSQIAAMVQSGSYKVDAKAVAGAIVDQSIAPGKIE